MNHSIINLNQFQLCGFDNCDDAWYTNRFFGFKDDKVRKFLFEMDNYNVRMKTRMLTK